MNRALSNRSIREAVPHVFKRPLLSVSPSDSLLQVGTFLAIGPQIYVDGLVVLDYDHKAVGSIGGRHIIEYILAHQRSAWSTDVTASNIMTRFDSAVEADHPLAVALDLFAKTEFAFVPITIGHRVVTSLSLRDVLKIVADSSLDRPIRELSSSMIAIDGKTSIGNAIEIMLEHGIRSLVVKQDENDGDNVSGKAAASILNDREILEFLMSHDSRQMMVSEGASGLFRVGVNTLYLKEARIVDPDISASTAAGLFDVAVPCLLLRQQNSIVTPWDIVIKGLGIAEQGKEE
jgi:predicted transcriptional regulator